MAIIDPLTGLCLIESGVNRVLSGKLDSSGEKGLFMASTTIWVLILIGLANSRE
jgi:hypothetical protein